MPTVLKDVEGRVRHHAEELPHVGLKSLGKARIDAMEGSSKHEIDGDEMILIRRKVTTFYLNIL